MNLPFPSKRAPAFADIPDEKWNDWRWQLSHRLNSAEEIEKVLPLTEDERKALSADHLFRVDITPYFISLIDPNDPDEPHPQTGHPDRLRNDSLHGRDGRLAAEDKHSPVPGLVHRYPDRVLMLVTTQCASYCRYCTRARIVGDRRRRSHARNSTCRSNISSAHPRCGMYCSRAATRSYWRQRSWRRS